MNLSKYKLITVEGNTGAGKTSLAQMLTEEYGARLILEEFADNPFLPKFYAEPEKYAFHTEMHFMLDRYHQLTAFLKDWSKNNTLAISDYIFRKSLLYAEVNLLPEEYRLFERLFDTVYPNLPQPDLIVYVHATVPRLLKNIQKRGRDFEQQVRESYLHRVEKIYFDYFKSNPHLRVLLIHADNLDFVHNPQHYRQILHWVNQDYPAGVNEVFG
ncbi:deoxynucleoside kinase [Sphingobacteriales bacterium UPWRP_1]|nr:hypothetical protein BVG80_12600 [Sphingobacteriales bacterium TSM_CSM]PSJ77867.1 deoxynucleoside kinase [Sphingobacteriales bacterium UPWRP_1]